MTWMWSFAQAFAVRSKRDKEIREAQIWRHLAYVMRYLHVPYDQALYMPLDHLNRLAETAGVLLEEENTPRDT